MVFETNLHSSCEKQLSPSSSPVTRRKRRLSKKQEVALVNIGTQSDISAETFCTYETRIAEARASRRVARAAKLNEIKVAKKLKVESLKTLNSKAPNDSFYEIDALNNNEHLSKNLKALNKKTKCLTDCNKSSAIAQPNGFSQRLRTALRDNHIAQFCFGCSLLLTAGFLLLTLLSAQTERNPMLMNNYRWSFGLQLDYVRGSPPI